MKRFLIVASVGAALAIGGPAYAMTDAECATLWTKADANKDGVVTESEARQYFAALRVRDKPVTDGKMTQTVFLEHCKAGHLTTASTEPGAPLPGSNSFTEAQAIDRVLAAGLGNISSLKKDPDGIWRGTASDGAKTVNVAVDYKGHVVAQ